VGRRVALLAAAVGALVVTPPAGAATQELTLTASDGTPLACALVEPDGTAPATGWPGVMLFHGLGGGHQDLEPLATQLLAPAGYASLACDARGQGASGGLFGLAGPRDKQDTKELFSWFAARPEISDSQIGALGVSLGGGAVWNATVAGVPFKAIVPMITWTNLAAALVPQGLARSGLVQYLAQLVPESRWDPELLAATTSLLASSNSTQVNALAAARSAGPQLGSISTPTLLIQGRRDFLFDADQALAAYRALTGPKRLYLGDLGHPPGASPVSAPDLSIYATEALKWFDRFLKGTANGIDKPQVELGHDPYDGKTTSYPGLPPIKTASVSLPGTATIEPGGKVVRGVRLTGGPHETFGASTVTVRYSNAKGWDRLVAVLAVAGNSTPISVGGVRLGKPDGVATIRLPNESVLVRAGARLVVYLGATSTVQSASDTLYVSDVPSGSSITIGRATLKLSVLKRAVSR
jgi:alpha-beta hydrolase superfamily lysophospholipase